MEIDFNARFKKQYKKLPEDIRRKFLERLDVFEKDSRDPSLRVHKLKGKDKPLISMNVTGNYRALFLRKGDLVVFHKIGTHSQLY